MADFGAFQLDTPQEIVARLQQNFAQNATTNNRVLNDTTVADRMFKGLFGDPRMKQAQEQQAAVTKAAEQVKNDFKAARAEGQAPSSLDEEIAMLRAQRDALLKTGAVDAATQATKVLTQLGIKKEELSRLKAAEDRSERYLRLNERNMDESFAQSQRMGNNIYTKKPNGDWDIIDPNNPEDVARLEAHRDAGNQLFTQEQAYNLTSQEQSAIQRAAEARLRQTGGPGKKFARDTIAKAGAANDLLNMSNNLIEFVRDDPTVMTSVSSFGKGLDKAITNLEDGMRTFGAGNYGPDGRHNLTVNRETLTKWRKKFSDDNIGSTAYRSMVVSLAYAIARAKDPGGRLSDDDFERALEIIGAGGKQNNPAAIATALEKEINMALKSTKWDLEMASKTPSVDAPYGEMLSRLDAGQQSFLETKASIEQNMEDSTGVTPYSPGAARQEQVPTPGPNQNISFKIGGYDK